MDLSKITGTIGRDELLVKLFKDVRKGKHRILVSDYSGIGLKTILKALHDTFRAEGYKIIFIKKANPMKKCLFDIVKQLYENQDLKFYDYWTNRLNEKRPWNELKKPIDKLNIDDLFYITIKSLQNTSKKYIIFINDLERLTDTQEAYFATLSDHTTLVGAANDKKKSKHLSKIWDELKEVKVPLLKDEEIKEIAKRFIERKALVVNDKKLLLTTIVNESRGNPSACANILDEFTGEKLIKKDYIRKIRSGVGVKEFDMTPFVFVIVAGFIGMRFLSLGLDDPMLYIMAGLSYATFYALKPFIYMASKRR